MDKKNLIKTCNNILQDIQCEMEKQNFVDAIPLLHDFFKQLQVLERDVDVFGDKQEIMLDQMINKLSCVNFEKFKDIKEIVGMLNTVEHQIKELKSYLFFGRTDEIINILCEIRNQLNLISIKI